MFKKILAVVLSLMLLLAAGPMDIFAVALAGPEAVVAEAETEGEAEQPDEEAPVEPAPEETLEGETPEEEAPEEVPEEEDPEEEVPEEEAPEAEDPEAETSEEEAPEEPAKPELPKKTTYAVKPTGVLDYSYKEGQTITLQQGVDDTPAGLTAKLNEIVLEQGSEGAWEYYDKNGDNKACGVTGTFISLSGGSHKVLWSSCTHPAIKLPQVGDNPKTFTVRRSDHTTLTGVEVTVEVVLPTPKAVITLAEAPYEVSMPYTKDGTVDVAAIKQRIIDALVESTEPEEIAAEDMIVEYHTTYHSSVTGDHEIWSEDFAGEKISLTVNAEPLKEGENTIRISCGRLDGYLGADQQTVTVNFVDGRKAVTPVELAEGETYTARMGYKLDEDGDWEVDYDLTARNIVKAVFGEELADEKFDVQHWTASTIGTSPRYVSLKGFTIAGLGYPAIAPGTATVELEWKGNGEYKSVKLSDVTVEMTGRDSSYIALNEGVVLVYDEDSAALAAEALAAVFNAEGSVLPAGANLSIYYKAEMELSDETLATIEGAVESVLGKYAYLGEAVMAAITEAIQNNLGEKTAAWVPFEGGKATISADLGLEDVLAGKFFGVGDLILEKLNSILGGIDLGITYDPIGAGEHEVRVKFGGSETHVGSASETTITINPAPVQLAVNSQTIHVDDPIVDMVIATRPDKDNKVVHPASYTVYSGITSDAKVLVCLDVPASVKRSPEYKTILSILSIAGDPKEGLTLKDLFDNDILGKLGDLKNPVDGSPLLPNVEAVIKNAISRIAGDQVDSEIVDRLLEALGSVELPEGLNKIKDAIKQGTKDAIDAVGDNFVFKLGTPEGIAGAYSVSAVLSDPNYKKEKAFSGVSVGYLVIQYHTIDVTVNSTTIAAGEPLPDDFITTDPEADTFVIYSGITSSASPKVYIDTPYNDKLAGFKTVGDLRKAIAEDPDQVLNMVGVDSSAYAKILTLAAMSELADDVELASGAPVNEPGAYAVTVVAYGTKDGKPWGYGVGVGTLGVSMSVAKVTVETAKIHIGEKLPDGFITVEPEDAGLNSYTVYAGVTADNTPVLYVDGVNIGGVKNVGELKAFLAANSDKVTAKLGIDNEQLAKLVARILSYETKIGNVTDQVEVRSGVPTEEPGDYTVIALAGKEGYVPAFGFGRLTVEDHIWDEGKVVTEPTCTEEGKKVYTCTCELSDGTKCTETKEETVEALGHDEVIDKGVEATCTTPGKTDGKHCDRCKEVLVEQEVINALGHDYEAVVTEPTCTTGGYTTYTCSRCEDSYVADETAPVNHNYEAVVTEPTCTAGGYTTYTCSMCQHSYTGNETDPIDHNYEAVVTEPTCTAGGYTTYTCSMCQHSYTGNETDPIDHNYEAVVTEPTCTAKGYTTHTCSMCGDSYTDSETEMAPHSYTTETKDPTCTEEGSATHTCSVCGHSYTVTIPANEHQPVTDKAVAPGCTTTGLTEGTHCGTCGKVLTAQQTLPATGHTLVTDEAVEATCTTDGKTEGSHCSVCGHVEVGQETIAAHHTVVEDPYEAPTCTTDGKTKGSHCSVCGTAIVEQKTIPAAHTAIRRVAGKDATCTETGLTVGQYCEACHTTVVEQEIIPALGHDVVVDQGVPATCTRDGLTEGSHCDRCGETLTEQEVEPATGHTVVIDPRVEPTCTTTGLTEGSHCGVCGTIIIPQMVLEMIPHADEDGDLHCDSCGEKFWFTVTYAWEGNVPGRAALPVDSNVYMEGDTYTVDGAYGANYSIAIYDEYDNVTGRYTFSGWNDPGQGVIGREDVVITGEWSYNSVAVPEGRVTYVWTGEPNTVILPVDNTVYVLGQPVDVDTTFVQGMTVENRNEDGELVGTYTFSGWTVPNGGIMTEDGLTITGSWTYATVIEDADVPMAGPEEPAGPEAPTPAGPAAPEAPVEPAAGPAEAPAPAPVATETETPAASTEAPVTTAPVEIEDSDIPFAAPEEEATKEVEEAPVVIEDNETPLAGVEDGRTWSLVSLLLMLGNLVLAIGSALAALKKRTKKMVAAAGAIAVVGIISAIVFFLTNDLTSTMVTVNPLTIVHGVMTAVSGIGAVVGGKKAENADEA